VLKISTRIPAFSWNFIQYIRFPNSPIQAFVIFLFTLSLLGTVTNYIPISAFACTPVFLIPLFLVSRESISKLVGSTYILTIYFIMTVLMYAPEQFLIYNFFRRDGNFFITFLPLLILGLAKIKIDLEGIVKRFLYWGTFVVFILLSPLILLQFKQLWTKETDFFMLFHAHNAAGGFLALTTCLTLGFALSCDLRKRFKWRCLFLINFTACFLTHSRGSALALLLCIFMILFLKPKLRKYFVTSIIIIISIITLYGYSVWLDFSPDSKGGEGIGLLFGDLSSEVSRSANIIDRLFFLWPQALDLFFHSPILGVGFGAYNDAPHTLEGFSGIFMLNNPERLALDSGHAHHSFYHIMAETGLVGLGLTLFMLHRMNIYIKGIKIDSLRLGMQLAFWMNIWSSMTEHRLFTPSQMLPFIIILSLSVASSRYENSFKCH
jgi:O-antigen ligase